MPTRAPTLSRIGSARAHVVSTLDALSRQPTTPTVSLPCPSHLQPPAPPPPPPPYWHHAAPPCPLLTPAMWVTAVLTARRLPPQPPAGSPPTAEGGARVLAASVTAYRDTGGWGAPAALPTPCRAGALALAEFRAPAHRRRMAVGLRLLTEMQLQRRRWTGVIRVNQRG